MEEVIIRAIISTLIAKVLDLLVELLKDGIEGRRASKPHGKHFKRP